LPERLRPEAAGEFAQGPFFCFSADAWWVIPREDEFNADEQAVKYTKICGYDSKAGINVMEKLYKEEKKTINPISFFSDSPLYRAAESAISEKPCISASAAIPQFN